MRANYALFMALVLTACGQSALKTNTVQLPASKMSTADTAANDTAIYHQLILEAAHCQLQRYFPTGIYQNLIVGNHLV